MKRNIDLTADFDFANTQTRGANISLRKFRGLIGDKRIVDIPYCIQNDIEHKQRGGIIQGDKFRRDFIKIVCHEIHCECCGRSQKYPWEKFCGFLCPQCDNRIERDGNLSQIPWNRA